MKVNIVGSGKGYQDAPLDEECWGFHSTFEKRPLDVVFDMHPIPDFLSGKRQEEGRTIRNPQSVEKTLLKSVRNNATIYSLEAYPGYTKYPIKEIVKKFDTSFFSGGLCYALALAIYKGATEIDIYGVVLISYEYKYEKEGSLYWIGLARGMGIKVTVHKPTNLFKLQARSFRGKEFPPVVYGYEVPQEGFIESVLTDSLEHHQSG